MGRRLIVCADGTWNTPEQEDEGHLAPTNVVKIYEALSRRPVASDGTGQLAFYHTGVGVEPNFVERGWGRVKHLLHIDTVNRNLFQGATGEGIDENIKDCYRWLVLNYAPGDTIYLFGFSRGAYTVRSLAGLIRNSGLLPVHNKDMVDRAFELYRDRASDTAPGADKAIEFRSVFSRDVDITCIGVWDTVGALGIPVGLFRQIDAKRYQFHDVTLSSHVRYAFHALAIDEQRGPFAPTLWKQQPDAGDQVLEQTWFTGVHCNIGGGYRDTGLSDITFAWMVERARRAGLEFDDAYATNIGAGRWNGVLRDSMSAIYQTMPPYVREIAQGRTAADNGKADAGREMVHDSVWERYGQTVPPITSTYSPVNLKNYRERFPVTT